jgi:hypothetical protein
MGAGLFAKTHQHTQINRVILAQADDGFMTVAGHFMFVHRSAAMPFMQFAAAI